jgi:hypothetical protein
MRRTACLLFAVVGAALCLLDASSARADVYDDNPATASRGPGDLWVFARASDGSILGKVRNSEGWSNWLSLGGNSTSGPAAVGYDNSILVFIRGTDGGIYQNTIDSTNHWGGWKALGGGVAASAPGVATRRGSRIVDMAVRGTDNAIWHRWFAPGSGWSAYGSIEGNLTSAPTLASQASGIVNIWARGTDAAVYQRSWDGTQWVAWSTLGGGIDGAPAAVSRTDNLINLYVRGSGNGLFARSWNGSAWSDWFLLDGAPISSAPAAAGDGPNHEWVVARGGNGVVLKEWTANAGWSVWQELGKVELPVVAPTPPGPPASAPLPVGHVSLRTGIACTPAAGLLRVSVAIKKPKGKSKPRVTKIVFFTKGMGRRIRTDRKAPFEVHLQINRPAGSTGRVYARVYYKRTAHGKTFRKVVSRRYKVCR